MTHIDLAQLQERLFSINNWPKNEWPELLDMSYVEASKEEDVSVELRCFIPQSLAWFEGHYPEQPVLPGVVQTYWVTELSQIIFQISEFEGINALKFINMIMPETALKLVLKFTPKTNSVAFTYFNDNTDEEVKCSTGKAVFAQS